MTYLTATLTMPVQLLLAEGGQPGGGNMSTIWIGLMLALAVFWIITMRGNSREKKQRKAMIDNLGKNDRVLTIGGIVGSVVAVKDDEVVVKVDETSNIKLTFTRSAIQKVLTGDQESK